jgi:PST family polysaccharide transporter
MSYYNFDPASNKLLASAKGGLFSSVGSQSIRLAVQVVSVALLSRLLSADNFGVVAAASPLVAFIALFQEMGFGQAIIQRSSVQHSEVNSLFWLNLLIAFGLAIALALLSPLAGAFYTDFRVGRLTLAMGGIILIGALGNQHNAILIRKMQFSSLAVIEGLSAIGGLAVTVLWALHNPSYWSLYAGQLTAVCITSFGCMIATGWLPTAPKHLLESASMVRFGAGLTIGNVFYYLARNADNVLIGRVWGGAILGLYDRAYKLLLFPIQQINQPVAKVMVPTLARLGAEPVRYLSTYLKMLSIVTLLAWPGIAVMSILSSELIELALGPNWSKAVPIFQALSFASFIQIINNTSGWLLTSQGRARDSAIWGGVTAVTSIAAFLVGVPFGAAKVALAYAICEYIRTPILWWFVNRRGPVSTVQILSRLVPQFVGLSITLPALFLVKKVSYSMNVGMFFTLIIGLTVAYILFAVSLVPFKTGRMLIGDAISQMNRVIRRGA